MDGAFFLHSLLLATYARPDGIERKLDRMRD